MKKKYVGYVRNGLPGVASYDAPCVAGVEADMTNDERISKHKTGFDTEREAWLWAEQNR